MDDTKKTLKLFVWERKWCAIKRTIFCDLNGVGPIITAGFVVEKNSKQNFKKK